MSLRVIDSGVLEPHWSAALDHALVDAVRLGVSTSTLHIYRRPPTVSLGYFQPSESVDRQAAAERGVAVLRRMSGGGTIFNDEGQLIYTLAVEKGLLPQGRDACLRLACAVVAQAISVLGVTPVLKEPNDVLVRGLKVSGNSQLRSASAVALQGTIILSPAQGMDVLRTDATKVGSLSEILGREVDLQEAMDALVESFAATLNLEASNGRPTEWEGVRAGELLRRRYGDEDFIWGR